MLGKSNLSFKKSHSKKTLIFDLPVPTQDTLARHIHVYIYDEYRRKKKLKGRLQKEEKKLKVFHHQIHQKLATDVIGCHSPRNDMKFSGIDMESP